MYTLVLMLKDGKARKYPVRELPAIIGSGPDAAIRIAHSSLLDKHARLFEKQGVLHIAAETDEGAIEVNGKEVALSPLKPGTEVRVGAALFKVFGGKRFARKPSPAAAAAQQPEPGSPWPRDPGDIRVKEEILQYHRKEAGQNRSFLGHDFSQYGGGLRMGIIAGLLALAIAIFFLFKWLAGMIFPDTLGL
ncbi:MAG: FHA domain-containing protein [Planctomycetota bacterium]|jgi:hypothetical protein